jgi:Protein of unknown function (DUF3307)
MNPRNLSASELLIWGLILHLLADWLLQNDWMSRNKANLLHSAGYIHAGIHGLLLSVIFGWVALPLAVAHLLIDTRKPVIWWSKLIRQTQPKSQYVILRGGRDNEEAVPIYDIGLEVRIWTDQVFHLACIAGAALLVA